jgi:hypothetical protein
MVDVHDKLFNGPRQVRKEVSGLRRLVESCDRRGRELAVLGQRRLRHA